MWRYSGAVRKDFFPKEQKQVVAGIGCKLWENGRLSVGSKFVTYYAQKSKASPWKALPGIDAEVCESKNAFFIRPIAIRLEHCNPALVAAAHYLKVTPYNLNVVSFNTDVSLGNIAGTFKPIFVGMELMQEVAEGLSSTEFCKIGFGIGVPGQWRAPLQMMSKTPAVDQLKLLRLLNPFQDEEEEEMNRMFRVLSNTLDTFLLGRRQLSAIEPRPEELDRLTRWQTAFQKKIATEQMVGDADSVDESDQQQEGFEDSLENSLGDDPDSPIGAALRRKQLLGLESKSTPTMEEDGSELVGEADPEGDVDAAAYRWEMENTRRQDYAKARLDYIRERLGVKMTDALLQTEQNRLETTTSPTPTTEGQEQDQEQGEVTEFLIKPVSDQVLETILRGGDGTSKEKKSKKNK